MSRCHQFPRHLQWLWGVRSNPLCSWALFHGMQHFLSKCVQLDETTIKYEKRWFVISDLKPCNWIAYFQFILFDFRIVFFVEQKPLESAFLRIRIQGPFYFHQFTNGICNLDDHGRERKDESLQFWTPKESKKAARREAVALTNVIRFLFFEKQGYFGSTIWKLLRALSPSVNSLYNNEIS